jgi:hypothetical protein
VILLERTLKPHWFNNAPGTYSHRHAAIAVVVLIINTQQKPVAPSCRQALLGQLTAPSMTDQQADSSSRVTICLALLLCIPCMKAESRSWFQATVEASSQRSGRAAAAAAVPLNNLTPGTPAVADSSSSSRWGVSRFSSSLTGHIHSQEGRYGWLFPVLTSTKRGNCVVYRVSVAAVACVRAGHQQCRALSQPSKPQAAT